MNKAREALGHIIKEERINLLKHHILPNSTVLSIDYPFPGFHGAEYDFTSKPANVILLTKELYSLAKILRAQKNINQKEQNLDLSFAKIKIKKQVYYGIRVKGLVSYEQIPDLQKELIHLGIDLTFKTKIETDKLVSIKISKFFHFEFISKDICKDLNDNDIYFIRITKYVDWENFRKITLHIKNNVSNNNFDVAKGVCYIDGGVTDFIRIYKNNISLKLIEEIKDKYQKEIN